ncbi:hypothetical protein C8Q77DRAFT_773182 [Trametes polyzona]|nr:hypothetical protein C8Q77DRAFT_773182 [Trametes polyzona]
MVTTTRGGALSRPSVIVDRAIEMSSQSQYAPRRRHRTFPSPPSSSCDTGLRAGTSSKHGAERWSSEWFGFLVSSKVDRRRRLVRGTATQCVPYMSSQARLLKLSLQTKYPMYLGSDARYRRTFEPRTKGKPTKGAVQRSSNSRAVHIEHSSMYSTSSRRQAQTRWQARMPERSCTAEAMEVPVSAYPDRMRLHQRPVHNALSNDHPRLAGAG